MKLRPLTSILTLLVIAGVFGEVRAGRFLYLPYIAPAPWETQLIATNHTESDQTIFVRFLQPPGLSQERAYALPARSTQEIALPGEIDSQAAYFLIAWPRRGARREESYVLKLTKEEAIEVCDGGPVDVELDVEYWLQQVGQVCFWTPTVVRELTVDEIGSGRLEP